MTERVLWIAKRLIIALIIITMIVISVVGCAKKTEDFEFSESNLEEKREENSGSTDTTPEQTDDPKEENQDRSHTWG